MTSRSRREKDAENHRRWRAKNPERFREITRRASRKLKGLPSPTRPEPQLCECCGTVFQSLPHKGPVLDHCHESGKFRGWVCRNCNTGLGLLGDTEAAILRALDYLRRNQ